jgi:hypothetical protein
MPMSWRNGWSQFESCAEAGSSSCKNVHTHGRFLHAEDSGRGSRRLALGSTRVEFGSHCNSGGTPRSALKTLNFHTFRRCTENHAKAPRIVIRALCRFSGNPFGKSLGEPTMERRTPSCAQRNKPLLTQPSKLLICIVPRPRKDHARNLDSGREPPQKAA